jgi:hypothetical protein
MRVDTNVTKNEVKNSGRKHPPAVPAAGRHSLVRLN